jgi:hypothetical protein
MTLRSKPLVAGAVLWVAHIAGATAGPADYVYTPAVEYGERELDTKFGSQRESDGTREHAGSLGFGWGVMPRWFTELYAEWERPAGESTELEAVEWENKFQLTETGQYPVDVGVVTELEVPVESEEAREFKIGALFQHERGRAQFNFNTLLERKFGGDRAQDEEREVEFGYQWQVKYRWRPAFEFGVQGFGEVGPWNDWDASSDQAHRLGPAAFGAMRLPGNQKIKYNAAWLHGVSDGAADETFRAQVEFEF